MYNNSFNRRIIFVWCIAIPYYLYIIFYMLKQLPNATKEDSIIDYSSNTDDESQGDDETIATFVTAAGQQLALYAVEDSEDIFAVSLYDESGEPPTNFQFLMKYVC